MAEKVRDYQKLAGQIIEILGKENITSVAHCATRLRLVLSDLEDGAKEKISALPGVITVVENGGQFQIVIGPHVTEVYQAFVSQVDVKNNEEAKSSVMNRIIATMSAVFAPFIYILAAAGILQGILILVNLAFPSFAKTGAYQVFDLISWAPFTFLPILIAITASKHFKVNTYIAIACCAALVSPSWTSLATQIANGKAWDFFGLPLSQTTYTSSVLPPLILVWILAYVEKFVEAKLPGVVKQLFTPLICLVIMVPLTLIVLGPLSSMLASGIANGYNWLVEVAPPLAAAIIGGLWQIVVIFGVHWGITPVIMANFDMYGKDSFQAFQTIAVCAQVAATLGVFLKANSKELKNISLSAFITGIFGITEPAIYGVTLRFKRPFIYGCISGAIGAVVASFFHPYYFAYAGLPGLLTTVNAINSKYPSSFIGLIIGLVVAVVCAVGLVMVFGFGENPSEAEKLVEEVSEQQSTVLAEAISLKAPLKGKMIALSEVEDEVFASGAMGQGVAIIPSEGKVVAPFDGTVSMLVNSGHAIGLVSEQGTEVLIHVGLDTVKLDGKPFKYLVENNQKVKQGDLLMEIDLKQIQAAGCPTVTPVIVTNALDYTAVDIKAVTDVATDDVILQLS